MKKVAGTEGKNRPAILWSWMLVLGAVLLMAAPALGAEGVTLVEKGKAQAIIVIPDEALPVVRYAADELQYHIEKATGAKLEIVPEGQAAATKLPHRIFLGHCKATRAAGIAFPGEVDPGEEYARNARVKHALRTVGGDLFLAGSDNNAGAVGNRFDGTRHGTLFAVYEFLERELGVRWLWPGELGEVIPRRENLVIGPLDVVGQERFAECGLGVKLQTQKHKDRWQSAKCYEAYAAAQKKWLLRQRMNVRNTVTYSYGHYFHGAGYTKRFLKSRPDFFQRLPDGTRGYIPGMHGHKISMCVGNPALHKQMVKDWQGYRKYELVRRGGKLGGGLGWMLNACENDTCAGCTCEKCRALDAKDPRFENHDYWSGGVLITDPAKGNVRYQAKVPDAKGRPAPVLSDRYARFYLALQKEAEKVNPRAVVFGYAYMNYVSPPVETKLNDRIVISMVPWPFFPWTDHDVEEMKDIWEKWHATGARLVLRSNTMLTGHNFPIFLARKIGEVFSHHAKHGAVATHFDSLTGQWGSKGPDLYVLTRMHVHPDWPVEKVLDEYYAGFGKASGAVKKYFEHWEQVSERAAKYPPPSVRTNADDAAEGGGWAGYRNFAEFAPYIFPPASIMRGHALLAEAKTAAAGNEQALRRVAFLEKGLIHAELTLAVVRVYESLRKNPRSPQKREALSKAMKKLMTYRRDVIEPEGIANVGFLMATEGHEKGLAWNHELDFAREDEILRLTPPVREVVYDLPLKWRFRGDPKDEGLKENWAQTPLNTDWQTIRTDKPWTEQDPGRGYHGVAWYTVKFALPKTARAALARGLNTPGVKPAIHFGAVDGVADVFLNGVRIGEQKISPEFMWDRPFAIALPENFDAAGPQRLTLRVKKEKFAAGVWKPVRIVLVENSPPK